MHSRRISSLILPSLLFIGFFFVCPAAFASITSGDMGANITPISSTDFDTDSFKQSLQQLKADHATAVSFVIPIYQTNIHSNAIYTGSNTPTDASIARAIQYAHGLGLSVTIKPHLDPQDGQWRAFIDPDNRTQWFAGYSAFMQRYATIAETNHAERFIIGTELVGVSSDTLNASNTQGWRRVIGDIRKVYSGQISYAANWGPTGTTLDEKNTIQFWSLLDFVGLDAYFPLSTTTSDISVASFVSSWNVISAQDIAPFEQRIGKPLVFTEIGFKSTGGAHLDPGDYTRDGGTDQVEQANLYEAFFSFWNTSPYLKGVYLWEWVSHPSIDSSDTNYTPQNKLAEGVVSRWFGGNGTAIPYTVLPHSLGVSAQSTSVLVGNGTSVSVSVVNNGRPESGLLVDIEVYDASGTKVLQKFYDNQSFAIGESKPYIIPWTPTTVGSYTVRMGVFSSNWSALYTWNQTAGVITVNAVTQPVKPALVTPTISVASSNNINQPLLLTLTAAASGAPQNRLIDVEIYDSDNQKKFQQFFSPLNFSLDETKQFNFSWTPNIAGSYRVAAGVFTNDWSQNYLWNSGAANFTVISQTQTPTSPVTSPTSTPVTPTTPTSTPIVPTPVSPTTTPVIPPAPTSTPTTTPITPPVVTPTQPATSTPTTTPIITPTQPTTTTPVQQPSPYTSSIAQSQIRNGNVTLLSNQTPSTLNLGQSGRAVVQLISQGDNANNVSVQMLLTLNNTVVAKSVASADILHDGQKSFEVSLASTLQSGTYKLQVMILNNADGLLNKQFNDIASVTVQ